MHLHKVTIFLAKYVYGYVHLLTVDCRLSTVDVLSLCQLTPLIVGFIVILHQLKHLDHLNKFEASVYFLIVLIHGR